MQIDKKSMDDLPGPVVIGGVGGSGTRVTAELLSVFGFFMGDDLNGASDNLLYTFLFKRPNWYYRNKDNKYAIETGLNFFDKVMTGKRSFALHEILFALQAAFSIAFFGHNYKSRGLTSWSLKRLQKIFSKKKNTDIRYIGWGWKEPNSHLLIHHLAECFKNFKYIHTIRHGLDMAFSRNQNQLFNWGPLYGVKRPQSPSEIPSASLRYWIRANKNVYTVGRILGPEKFLNINFEKLCHSPETEIKKIAYFLNINPDEKTYQRALILPRKPKSMRRYLNYDLAQFDRADLDALSEFGYAIE